MPSFVYTMLTALVALAAPDAPLARYTLQPSPNGDDV